MMFITKKIKENFCQNNNINIRIYDEPYFTERLKLYDKYFGSYKKWKLFLKETKSFKNEIEYMNYFNKVKKEAINAIKETSGFQKLKDFNIDVYKYDTSNIPTKNIYSKENNNKIFLSIDLVKGCFSAMKFFDETIFNGIEHYEDFIKQFTDKDYLINSKHFRQLIFGDCEPRKQNIIEKYMMKDFYEIVQKHNLKIASFTHDELVIELPKHYSTILDKLKEEIFNCASKKNIDIHFDIYKISQIKNSNVFIKEFFNKNNIEIKCATHVNLPLVIRILNKEDFHENDLIVENNGDLIKIITLKELDIDIRKNISTNNQISCNIENLDYEIEF